MIKKQLLRILPLCLVVVTTSWGRPCLAQLQPVKVKGVVAAISPSPQGLVIRDDKGKIMLALTSPRRVEDGVTYRGIPQPTIEIISQEKPDYLQIGMWVRFPARVQAKRRVVEPVKEVTIISGLNLTAFGVLPVELPDVPQEGADKPATKAQAVEDSLVVGRIASARRNAITVVFPDGKSIKAGLAKDAIVHVKAADIRFAKVGYLVEASGMLVKPNRFFATQLKVTKPTIELKAPKPAPVKVAKQDKAGTAKPAIPPKPDPFKIGKAEDKPGVDAKPAKVRGRILKIN